VLLGSHYLFDGRSTFCVKYNGQKLLIGNVFNFSLTITLSKKGFLLLQSLNQLLYQTNPECYQLGRIWKSNIPDCTFNVSLQ
jgi:hypothetical protein